LAAPEWGDFRIVLALGRGGSVAAAGRLLEIDSSTVSRRLIAVEEALGAMLVIRGGREFCLTAEGREAFAAAEAIEAAVTSATAAIHAGRTTLDGVVRISCVSTITNMLLPFSDFVRARHPKLAVQFIPTNRSIDLGRGEADIAIRNVRPTEGDLIARRGFELGMAVYAVKGYLEQHGTPLTHDELRGHRLVQYDERMLHLPWFAWIEQFADPNTPATRVESTESASFLVASGGGIGVLTCPLGDYLANAVRVFPEPIHQVQTWFVYHEASRGSARIKAVVELLEEFADTRREVFRGIAS
jgi:DNA-binding transcriptional LysR family regulator